MMFLQRGDSSSSYTHQNNWYTPRTESHSACGGRCTPQCLRAQTLLSRMELYTSGYDLLKQESKRVNANRRQMLRAQEKPGCGPQAHVFECQFLPFPSMFQHTHCYHTLKQLCKPESIARITCALVHKYPYWRYVGSAVTGWNRVRMCNRIAQRISSGLKCGSEEGHVDRLHNQRLGPELGPYQFVFSLPEIDFVFFADNPSVLPGQV